MQRGSSPLWGIMSCEGIHSLTATAQSGDDEMCLKYFLEPQPYDAIVGAGQRVFEILRAAVPAGDVPILFVDRLGVGGRGAATAIKQHANPRIKAEAIRCQSAMRLLPGGGAIVDPIECIWDRVKREVSVMPPPGPPRYDSYGHQILRPTTWAEFKSMLATVVEKLNKNKAYFRACVYRRGLGADAYRRWFHTDGYKAIKDNIKPYDIVKLSQRGTLVEPSLSPPLTRALCASYARWWYQNAVAGMLPISPPPGPAGRVGTDGTEDTCRCCGKGKTKGNATGELLCCEAEGCTAAWHFSCLLMKVPPRGSERWECPGCALAPRRKCHPQWPTVAEEKKRRETGLLPAEPEMNLLASDSDDEE